MLFAVEEYEALHGSSTKAEDASFQHRHITNQGFNSKHAKYKLPSGGGGDQVVDGHTRNLHSLRAHLAATGRDWTGLWAAIKRSTGESRPPAPHSATSFSREATYALDTSIQRRSALQWKGSCDGEDKQSCHFAPTPLGTPKRQPELGACISAQPPASKDRRRMGVLQPPS